ncbi:hypothetical protein PsYK624_017830 [Phanerochaete sordida]|uniref:Uncharacterized protein n=1 Tax=Phanerochaete sordida TaxID=48140 RepID=A0A9P3L8N9_9APHY|nr:hypothetical protein PsYK624_017830 [Phanerochaete sordida]
MLLLPCRFVFCYLVIPWLRTELDEYIEHHNNTPHQADKHKVLPHCVPEDIFDHPENYGVTDYRIQVPNDVLQAAEGEWASKDHPVFQLVLPPVDAFLDEQLRLAGNPRELRTANYSQWRGDCSGTLIVKGWLRITQGKERKPTPKDATAPTVAEQDKLDEWEKKALRATGEFVHFQKRPGMRFNVWEKEFFSVDMEESDSLSSLMIRVNAAIQKVKDRSPDTFALEDVDKELVSMTLICALHSCYAHFLSSWQLLDKLDKNTLQAAVISEEALCSCTCTPATTAC